MILVNHIINKLQNTYPETLHVGDIERIGMEAGYSASNAARRCRELVNEGKIEVIYNKKHQATYRYIPHSDNPVAQKFLTDFPSFAGINGKEIEEALDKLTLF